MIFFKILFFLVSMILSLLFTIFFHKLLFDNGMTDRNYMNDTVTLGLGIMFIFNQLFICTIIIFWKLIDMKIVIGYLLAITLMAFIGFMDDTQGDKRIKGLKGHLKAFVNGNFTTGGFKAISGLIIALFFSLLILQDVFDFFINTAIISLFTNTINLFDLRPGRATKVSLLFLSLLLLLSTSENINYMIIGSIGMLIGYIWIDLKGSAMMGDTGSNTLGMILGIICVLSQNSNQKIVWLLITLMLHILSEKHSFSSIIEKSKVLSYIDHLGR